MHRREMIFPLFESDWYGKKYPGPKHMSTRYTIFQTLKFRDSQEPNRTMGQCRRAAKKLRNPAKALTSD